MNICPKCGLVCGERQSFCERCGTPMFATRSVYDADAARLKEETAYAPYGWAEDTPYAAREQNFRQTETNYPKYQPPSAVSQDYRYSPSHSPANMPSGTAYNPYQSQISEGYRCPRCYSNILPQIKKKVCATGWITFALLLFIFPPLCWLGFFIKEPRSVCPRCNFNAS